MKTIRPRPRPRSRKAFAALALLFAASAPAQQSRPPGLEPLPADALPPQVRIDPTLEPAITIISRGGDKIEEFRVRGRLYMVRVTPPGGTPYMLIDHQGDGKFASPAQGPADAHGISVPLWVIGTF